MELFNFKSNSFGFLRFIFAIMVLYSHSFVIGGFGKEPIETLLRRQESVASIAVYGFFIISGLLVTRSLITSQNLFEYGIKRALRIFPGFWVCLVITAFVFAPIVFLSQYHTLNNFMSDKHHGPFHYIFINFFLLMHDYSIANVLNHNPLPYIFDGSLWTLWLEAKAYVLLGILGIWGIQKQNRYFVLALFLVLYSIILFQIPIHDSSNKFLRLILDTSFLHYATYFFIGSVFFLFKEQIPYNKNLLIAAVIITIVGILFGILRQILPLTLPFIILWLAQNLPFQTFAKYGDFSYGIYIYAFPIQQLAAYFHLNGNITEYILLCFLGTMLFAIPSWYIIEKPSLDLKKHAGSFMKTYF